MFISERYEDEFGDLGNQTRARSSGWCQYWKLERSCDIASDELRRDGVQPAEGPVHLPRLVVQQKIHVIKRVEIGNFEKLITK